MLWLAVAGGGALGSVARFATARLVTQWFPGVFPWGTFVANIAGCFLMGLLAALLAGRTDNLVWRAFLLTGFLGGYTTFSSFAQETLTLARHGEPTQAAMNIAATVLATLLAVWMGARLGGL